jgi:hypothetical protein
MLRNINTVVYFYHIIQYFTGNIQQTTDITLSNSLHERNNTICVGLGELCRVH